MKKALDYVSDYQLKSACKDAICIAPSKVTQMIFAALEDYYHHVVLTHILKLVSFFLHILHIKQAQFLHFIAPVPCTSSCCMLQMVCFCVQGLHVASAASGWLSALYQEHAWL